MSTLLRSFICLHHSWAHLTRFSSSFPLETALVDAFDVLEEAAGVANDGNAAFGGAIFAAGVEELKEKGFFAAGAAAGVEELKEKPPNGFEGVPVEGVPVRFTEAKAPFPALPGVDDWYLQLFCTTKNESHWVRNHIRIGPYIQIFSLQETSNIELVSHFVDKVTYFLADRTMRRFFKTSSDAFWNGPFGASEPLSIKASYSSFLV